MLDDTNLSSIKEQFGFLHDRELAKLQKLAEAFGEEFSDKFIEKTLSNLTKIIPNSVRPVHLVQQPALDLIKDISRDDGLVVLELQDGTKLKTFESRQQYRNYYYCFRRKLPAYFSPESYQACHDIQFRYLNASQAIEDMSQTGLLKPGGNKNIIECGAYVGWKALGYARHIGPNGKILVLEIDERQFNIARENLTNNLSPDQFAVLNKGVWNTVEEKQYTFEHFASHSLNTPDEHSHHTQSKRIVTDTLDNIIEEAGVDVFDFANIQTGGSELESVQGLDRNLNRVKVLWLGTHYEHEGQTIRYRCIKHLLEKGCRIYAGGKRTTVEIHSIDGEDPTKKGGFYAVTPAHKNEIVPKLG